MIVKKDNLGVSAITVKESKDSSYINSLSFGEQWYVSNIINHIHFFENYIELKNQKKKISSTLKNEFKQRIIELKNLLQKDKDLLILIFDVGLNERFNTLVDKIDDKDIKSAYHKNQFGLSWYKYWMKIHGLYNENEFLNNIEDSNGETNKNVITNKQKISRTKKQKTENVSPKYFTWLGTRQQLKKIINASIEYDLFDIDLNIDINIVIDAHFKIKNEKCDRLKQEEKIRWKHDNVVLLVCFFHTMREYYELLSITHKSNMHEVLYNNFVDINGNDFNLGTLRTSNYNYTRNKKSGKPIGYDIIEKVLLGIPKKKN